MPEINKDGLSSDVAEYIAELEKSLDEAVDLIDELATDEDTDTDDVIDEVVEDLEDASDHEEEKEPALSKSAQDYISKMETDLADARTEIAKERQIRVMGEMVAKASTFDELSVSKAELGGVLYELHNASPELAGKVEAILKSANDQLEAADMFGEIGKTAVSTTIASSAEAAASEIQKAEGITFEAALAKAYENNPALYVEHLKGVN